MTIAMQDYLRDELHVTKLKDLGHGGFADVYAGEKDEVLQAFKVSKEPLSQKLRDMATEELAFMKERAIRACDHIVQLRGVHWHLGHLITRWDLGEESLGDRLKAAAENGQMGLPLGELRRYLLDAAAGIDVVNGMGIKHRDIKPDNLLLFLNGRVKVADFGLAVFTGASTMSKTGSGTHGYIALEAYALDGRQRGLVKDTIDIYSLAATAIKLATGHDPFGENVVDIIDAQRAGRPITTGLTPPQTVAVIAALHPDPKQRPFKTTTEFVQAFLAVPPLPAAVVGRALLPVGAPVAPQRPAATTPLSTTTGNGQLAAAQVGEVERQLPPTPTPSKLPQTFPSGRLWLGLALVIAFMGACGMLIARNDQPPQRLPAARVSVPQSVSLPEPLISNSIGTTAGERRVMRVANVDCVFRWCPAGAFKMGSPSGEQGRDSDEAQVYVTLSKGFWMLETEVTQELWMAVMGTTLDWKSYGQGPKYPVYNVSHNDATKFCVKFNALVKSIPGAAGMSVSLPTEAQWEYAARAGTTTLYYWGDSDSQADQYAWYSGNSGSSTHPVGQKKPNAWGLHDMSGNVREWCSDWYDHRYYQKSAQDPMGPKSGNYRVLRGGSWGSYGGFTRSTYSNWTSPDCRGDDFGFRVVCVSAPRT